MRDSEKILGSEKNASESYVVCNISPIDQICKQEAPSTQPAQRGQDGMLAGSPICAVHHMGKYRYRRENASLGRVYSTSDAIFVVYTGGGDITIWEWGKRFCGNDVNECVMCRGT